MFTTVKFRISLFLFILPASFFREACGQPVVNEMQFPGKESHLIYTISYNDRLTEASPGVDQTWDFSSLKTELGSEIKYHDPSLAKSVELFPECSIVYGSTNETRDYTFLNVTNDRYEYLGFEVIGHYDYVAKYNDPWIIYSLPLRYSDRHKDTYSGSSRLIHQVDTIDLFFSGDYSYVVDGYGTLITPDKTFLNTLRVNAIIFSTDSAVYRSRNDSSSVTRQTTNKVTWISSDPENPGEAAATFDFKDFFFCKKASGVNAMRSVVKNTFRIYPDPAVNEIHVEWGQEVTPVSDIHVYNSMGSIVKSIAVSRDLIKNNRMGIAVSELAPGMYFVKWITSDGEREARFVKQ